MQDSALFSSTTQSTAPYSPQRKKFSLRKYNPKMLEQSSEYLQQHEYLPLNQIPVIPYHQQHAKKVTCVKSYERKDLNSIMPNSIDEDLTGGEDSFLKVREGRLGESLIMKPVTSSSGYIINRSIVGLQDHFMEKLESNTRQQYSEQDGQRLKIPQSEYKGPLYSPKGSSPNAWTTSYRNRIKSSGNSPTNISFAAISQGFMERYQPLTKQSRKYQPKKNYQVPQVDLSDAELENVIKEIKQRNVDSEKCTNFKMRKLSMNMRQSMTRDKRMLQHFDKYQDIWKEQSARLISQRDRLNLQSHQNHRTNISQAKKDISIIERLDYEQERQNDKKVLELALPNELSFGQNSFYWSLRNSPQSCKKKDCVCQGDLKRPNFQTYGYGPLEKCIAQPKMAEVQNLAVAKANIFSLKKLSAPLTRSTAKPKTFKDFPEVQSRMLKQQDIIQKVKAHPEYEDICNMYIEGQSKLKEESQAARRITSNNRKLLILNNSLATTVSNLSKNYGKIVQFSLPHDNEESNNQGEEEVISKYDINHIYY